jgi:simple sugar transport system ATP-binding protein
MISAELKPPSARPPRQGDAAPARLVLNRLTVASPHAFGTDLRDISLTLRQGEILGIAGIAGNGQNELMDALSGEILAGKPETILIDNVPAGHLEPQGRRKLLGCFVPEERNGHGAVGAMSLAENAFLSGFVRAALTRWGLIDRRRTADFASDIIKRFDVRTTGPAAAARSLSGGNLQKFLVGREILQQPAVLVINQPTWGVDAGAALAIHEAIRALTDAGAATIIISQDLDEIFALADQVAVIAGGRLSDPVPVASATIAAIGRLMGGVEPAHA